MHANNITNSICMGSLKTVKNTNIIDGYSKKHLKSFYGQQKFVYIKGTSNQYLKPTTEKEPRTSITQMQQQLFMGIENGVLTPCNNGEYLVKPTPNALASLSENEHAMMKLCEAVGLKTAPCTVVPFEDGELAYITKRSPLTTQITHKNHRSYENTLKQMVYKCAGAQAAALIAIRMLILGHTIGNSMGINTFYIYKKSTNKTHVFDGFTPVNNMISATPYPQYQQTELSLKLLETQITQTPSHNQSNTTFTDFVLLAHSLGLTEKAATILITNFASVIDKKAIPLLINSHLPNDMKRLLITRISSKCAILKRGN